MKNKYKGVWQEIKTRDWFWIEKKGGRYFSSCWITCTDAVLVIQGKKPTPETFVEVSDIDCFEPVPEAIIRRLTRTIDKLEQDRA